MTKPPSLILLGVALILTGYACHVSDIDLTIAEAVHNYYGGFPRNAFLLRSVMHEGMRNTITSILALLVIILIWDAFSPRQWLQDTRTPLRIFAVCAAVFIGSIAALKAFTTPACPWDLGIFGGHRSSVGYADIFRTSVFGKGHCFPAGHSTAGYVWLCLAFVLSDNRKSFIRLFVALLPIGISLSTAQILRGAHFLSHELTTLGIALIIFSILPALLVRKAFSNQSKAPSYVP